jgi:hypothetical protein
MQNARVDRLEQRQLLTTLTGTTNADVFELQQQSDGSVWVWFNRPNTSSPSVKILNSQPIDLVGNGGADTVIFDTNAQVGREVIITTKAGSTMTAYMPFSDQELTIDGDGQAVLNIGDVAPPQPNLSAVFSHRRIEPKRHWHRS